LSGELGGDIIPLMALFQITHHLNWVGAVQLS
jgi:hypothetical protein